MPFEQDNKKASEQPDLSVSVPVTLSSFHSFHQVYFAFTVWAAQCWGRAKFELGSRPGPFPLQISKSSPAPYNHWTQFTDLNSNLDSASYWLLTVYFPLQLSFLICSKRGLLL